MSQSNIGNSKIEFGRVKIVSGGQSGVDRAALDWAIQNDLPHGGWCPKGRTAEDGRINTRYALRETDSGGYRQRTRQNVIDSDGTLILNIGELSDGSLVTLCFAERFGKPHRVIRLDSENELESVRRVIEWIGAYRIGVLNIAGPRESKRPGVYRMALAFLGHVICRNWDLI